MHLVCVKTSLGTAHSPHCTLRATHELPLRGNVTINYVSSLSQRSQTHRWKTKSKNTLWTCKLTIYFQSLFCDFEIHVFINNNNSNNDNKTITDITLRPRRRHQANSAKHNVVLDFVISPSVILDMVYLGTKIWTILLQPFHRYEARAKTQNAGYLEWLWSLKWLNVMDNATIWKIAYEFLYIHLSQKLCVYTLYCFQDIAMYFLKIAYFPTSLLFVALLRVTYWNSTKIFSVKEL